MRNVIRKLTATVGLSAVLAVGMGTVLAAPASAYTAKRKKMLVCVEKSMSDRKGMTMFAVACKGNPANPYWAEGSCTKGDFARGTTQFPPFFPRLRFRSEYGPWSVARCPKGQYLSFATSIHG